MKILGIVAEYDPFHRGHEQHLALARKMVSPSAVYIALSPCFRQRGDISLLSPYVRARCALACGADAVFSLPVFQVLNDGLQYAAHAVRLLHALGCTHLAFGAETADPDLLQKTASLLEDPPDALLLELRNGLNRGLGYPEAQEAALRSVFPEGEAILSHPNNILAVAYLRAIRKMNLRMIPVPIPRSGNDRSNTIDPESPSASAIRKALLRGNWTGAFSGLPEVSRQEIQRAFLQHQVPDERILDQLLLSRLRAMSPAEASRLPNLSEGLENRLLQEAKRVSSRAELLDRVSSRRYTRARVNRLCASALLGLHASANDEPVSEALLLGLRRKPEITAPWKDLPIPVLSSVQESKHPPLWEADVKAWKIWAQCASMQDVYPYSAKLTTLD